MRQFLNGLPARPRNGTLRAGFLVSASCALLIGCGGGGSGGGGGADGGGAPTFRIGGQIFGIDAGESVTLVNAGTSQTFEGAAASPVIFELNNQVTQGRTYDVRVQRQPVNVLCRVDNGTGTANARVTNISVLCHETVIADSGVTVGLDGATGRDAVAANGLLTKVGAGRAGFDYTRVCNSGEAAGSGGCPATPVLGAGANDWGCTRDNVTGLLWQVNPAGGAVVRDSAQGEADAATAASLCGATNWRLPTAIELSGLLDSGAPSSEASTDTDFFPSTSRGPYWTGEPRAGDAATSWVVDFDTAAIAVLNVGGVAEVRAVSGTSSAPALSVVSGTIFEDSGFQLGWLATGDTGNQAQAEGAATAVNNANTGGFSDWRLPNRVELATLVDRTQSGPAVAADINGHVVAQGYWSTTPFSTAPSVTQQFSWVVDFDSGDVLPRPVEDVRNILLVRNLIDGE